MSALETEPKPVAKKPAAKKPPKPAVKKEAVSKVVVSTVSFVELNHALSPRKGSAVRDRLGNRKTAGRTERLSGAKVYRTGEDEMTVQDANGDEILFVISRLEQVVAIVKGMAETTQIPNFENRL